MYISQLSPFLDGLVNRELQDGVKSLDVSGLDFSSNFMRYKIYGIQYQQVIDFRVAIDLAFQNLQRRPMIFLTLLEEHREWDNFINYL